MENQETKLPLLTGERLLYSVVYYLIFTGFIANLFVGNFCYKEFNRPGSALMVGDLSGVPTPKGLK